MDITVHKFKEGRLSVFTLSTEFSFIFDSVSLSLSSYLSGCCVKYHNEGVLTSKVGRVHNYWQKCFTC